MPCSVEDVGDGIVLVGCKRGSVGVSGVLVLGARGRAAGFIYDEPEPEFNVERAWEDYSIITGKADPTYESLLRGLLAEAESCRELSSGDYAVTLQCGASSVQKGELRVECVTSGAKPFTRTVFTVNSDGVTVRAVVYYRGDGLELKRYLEAISPLARLAKMLAEAYGVGGPGGEVEWNVSCYRDAFHGATFNIAASYKNRGGKYNVLISFIAPVQPAADKLAEYVMGLLELLAKPVVPPHKLNPILVRIAAQLLVEYRRMYGRYANGGVDVSRLLTNVSSATV